MKTFTLTLFALIFSATLFGAEVVEPATTESWKALLLAALQSPMAITVVAFVLSFVIGKIFTAKPKWKVYADKYRPLIVSAIKKAEKEIPDDTENKSLARLDTALKYVIAVEAKLDAESLKEAITTVHAEIEK